MRTAPDLPTAIEWAKEDKVESMVKCPAHEDGNASLHVTPGQRQPVVMTCHAQCQLDDILREGGVDMAALMGEKEQRGGTAGENRWTPVKGKEYSHRYPYFDEEGTLLFEVLRIPLENGKKTFRQRHPNPDQPGRYIWNMEGVRRVLYRLPEVVRAVNDGIVVWIVEGEKDVESLRALGEVATTSPMGAGKWQKDFSQSLRGASVIIIPDTDATGRAHARQVREELLQEGCSVRVMEPAQGSKDVTEHLEKGGTLDTLLETVPEVAPEARTYGVDVLDLVQRTVKPTSFVIPGLMARGDRFLLTAFEGHGKSMLLRQIATMTAAGFHCFTGQDIPPQKVLMIDSENHPDQVLEPWQSLVGLAAHHGRPIERGMLTVLEEWDNEIDLTSESGRSWLVERVHAYKPDLVCLGPLYTMSGRDLKDDETVRKIKSAINEARNLYGSAIVMEHHAPHKGPNDKERSVRPYGSSTFLKFPEFGYGLKPTDTEGYYEFQKTRMPRIRSRVWPTALRWGRSHTDEWPWVEAHMDDDGNVY